ncbi:translation initiation factor eIF 4e-like domain-containing protein [Lipomyces doorenjongii]|uniref:translation initiation factor eIF 4e-like domain-containing protein n=1 Tax=Lipomyces doorenjongii TaxID=383834 RepID=UPI0034CE8331
MAETESATAIAEIVNEKEPTPAEVVTDETAPAEDTPVEAETKSEAFYENKTSTVFDSTIDFTVKHPLRHTWTLWYTKPQHGGSKSDWGDQLKEVINFDSVEEFWGIYNNIPKASELPQKSDYHLFKKSVRPEWEDVQNENGGKWAYQCRDKRQVDIDDLWLNTLLGAVGETLEDEGENEIMGVVVTIRKAHYRISIWTRTANNEKALLAIGRRFKELLKLPPSEQVDYSSHKDAATSGSSRAKPRFSA